MRGESYGEDYSAPVLAWRVTWRKARKRWRCVECGLEIAPGERYLEMSGVWEDLGPGRFRMCAGCEAWATAARNRLRLEHYPIGSLAEAIAEFTRDEDGSYHVRRPRL